MNTKKMAIIFGAMLHDIGKFMQRAEIEKIFPQIKSYYDDFCPTPTSYLHAAHSAFFVEKFLPENTFNKEVKQILYDACRHHRITTAPDIFQQSDRISSGMDRSEMKADMGSYKQIPLYPIFDCIELSYSIFDTHGNFQPRWYYPLSKLTISKDIFPKHMLEKKEEGTLVADYEELWKSFIAELDDINRVSDDLNMYFTELFYLLHKYTWCIPSATNVLPDISLFDHLKTTAAIAACLYDVDQSKSPDGREFILFGADLSGIQSFIFRIAVAQGIGGISKRLRGRSFYIMMLMEVLSRYIIHKLDLTLANINFCGGGNFELLLPHTKEVIEFLKAFELDVNHWLLERFQGQIGLISDYVILSKNDLTDQFSKYKDQLQDAIAQKKRRKFKEFFGFQMIKDDSTGSPIRICPSCQLSVLEKHVDSICSDCQNHKTVGAALPETRVLVFSSENSEQMQTNALAAFSYGKFGTVYLCDALPPKDQNFGHGYFESVKVDQSYSNGKGFYFLSNVLPVARKTMILETEIDPDGETQEEKTGYVQKGQTLSFQTLADMATGDSRIGILKMDVDNLGLIFSIGLEPAKSDQQISSTFRSISRISAVSRELSYFFNGIVNFVCDQITDKWRQESDWKEKFNVSGIFYVVFSGGDDLVIIGPWDWIIELAFQIRQMFKNFTCHNPNLTISAGIFICKPKYPISLAVKKAEEALKRSKEKGKNRITVFDDTVVWDIEDKHLSRVFDPSVQDRYISFEENEVCKETLFKSGVPDLSTEPSLVFSQLLQFEQVLSRLYKAEKIPRRFVHQLIEGKKKYFPVLYNSTMEREEEYHNKMILPYLFYIMRRNLDPETFQELQKEMIIRGEAQSLIRQIKIPTTIFLMKTRQK